MTNAPIQGEWDITDRWRIASPDLLPGEGRCRRLPAAAGRHDGDDQCGGASGVDGGGSGGGISGAPRRGDVPDAVDTPIAAIRSHLRPMGVASVSWDTPIAATGSHSRPMGVASVSWDTPIAATGSHLRPMGVASVSWDTPIAATGSHLRPMGVASVSWDTPIAATGSHLRPMGVASGSWDTLMPRLGLIGGRLQLGPGIHLYRDWVSPAGNSTYGEQIRDDQERAFTRGKSNADNTGES